MSKRISTSNVCPTALGTGLLALDVVCRLDSNDIPPCYAGGTCGNVLTILSYLGWNTLPISRLAPGKAAEYVLNDLQRWDVGTSFVSVKEGGSTPIIIHRIGHRSSGEPFHSFSWRCPTCGAHLPGYKPILAGVAQELTERLPASQVFFFDRVSRGALHLAKEASDRGAVVFFEPCGIGDPTLFREAWSLSHVVKYSHEQLRERADLDLKQFERQNVLLEIETLGPMGLRYRSRLPGCSNKGWITQSAFAVKELKDTAGSGDWCSAGLLDKLARKGLKGLRKATLGSLREAIRYSQALATWNCNFDGARGGMYKVDPQTFRRQVEQILEGDKAEPPSLDQQNPMIDRLFDHLCPTCKENDFVFHSQRRSTTSKGCGKDMGVRRARRNERQDYQDIFGTG